MQPRGRPLSLRNRSERHEKSSRLYGREPLVPRSPAQRTGDDLRRAGRESGPRGVGSIALLAASPDGTLTS